MADIVSGPRRDPDEVLAEMRELVRELAVAIMEESPAYLFWRGLIDDDDDLEDDDFDDDDLEDDDFDDDDFDDDRTFVIRVVSQ
jgi:hypothetical protein